jgi:hypothetical protein
LIVVGLLTLLVGVGFMAMAGTFAYQLFLYLKYGHWPGMSVTYACGTYLEWDWCNFPKDWLGVYNLLSWLNAGVFVFGATVFACFFVAAAMGEK